MDIFITSKTKQQMLLKLILLGGLLQSCASVSDISMDKIYRKEADILVDNVKAKGTYVAPRRSVYKIRIDLPSKPHITKLTTCHREITYEDVGKKLEYDYKPVEGLEDVGSCMLEVASFDDKGTFSSAVIDFESADEVMHARIGCNGDNYMSNGASLCQSKAGLIQTVSFMIPVKAYFKEECPPMETKDDKFFTYVMASDKCVYLFSDDKIEHRHTTFGYDEVLLK